MEFCTANGRLQPGFRFYPTDEELVMYYLKRKVLGKRLEPIVVAEVDIYQFHPEDLRDLAYLQKDRNWYFFCPRSKKYGCGDRTNRATNTGFWKATGNDRLVTYGQRTVGKIKTLVFHLGKPPKGDRTDWVMHEFRLDDKKLADLGVSQDSYVLCKIFKKSGWGPKNGEQYGAPFIEVEWDNEDEIPNSAQMVPCDVQNHSISAVTRVVECTNSCPTYTSEQVYSGSVSAVDQAPPSTSNAAAAAAANIVSFSNVLIPNPSPAIDQVPTLMSIAADWNLAYSVAVSVSAVDQPASPTSNAAANLSSSSNVLVPNHIHATVQTPTPMSVAVDWTSCSMAYSGAVSVSAVDQPPSPTASAAYLASSSKSAIPYYNAAVNQANAAMPIRPYWASTSTIPVPNYYDPAVHLPTPAMPRAAVDIASTSTGLVPIYDDDEIFTADDLRGIFDGLPDLDNGNVQGNEPPWGNFYEGPEGGLGLTDLDESL